MASASVAPPPRRFFHSPTPRRRRPRAGGGARASTRAPPPSSSSSSSSSGFVHLVGAGPGGMDDMTTRALRLVRECDVLVYDDLGASERDVLAEARADAERIYVGSARPGALVPTRVEGSFSASAPSRVIVFRSVPSVRPLITPRPLPFLRTTTRRDRARRQTELVEAAGHRRAARGQVRRGEARRATEGRVSVHVLEGSLRARGAEETRLRARCDRYAASRPFRVDRPHVHVHVIKSIKLSR